MDGSRRLGHGRGGASRFLRREPGRLTSSSVTVRTAGFLSRSIRERATRPSTVYQLRRQQSALLLCQHEKIAVQIAHGYVKATSKPMSRSCTT
jgi:hypothetical protein